MSDTPQTLLVRGYSLLERLYWDKLTQTWKYDPSEHPTRGKPLLDLVPNSFDVGLGFNLSDPEYGIEFGAGKSQAVRLENLVQLRAVAALAVDANMPMFYPTGTLELEIDPDEDTGAFGSFAIGLNVPTGLKQYGAGPGKTILRWYPENTDNLIGMFFDGRTEQIVTSTLGITMQGSTTAPPSGSTPSTYAFYHKGSTTEDRNDQVVIEDFAVTGKWSSAFNSSDGTGEFILRDYDITSDSNGISFFLNEGQTPKTLRAIDGYIHDITDYDSLSGHGVYIHPSATYEIRRLRGKNLPYYLIQTFGSPTDVPEYQIINGCIAVDNVARGIMSGRNVCAQITENTLKDVEIFCYGDALITANRFVGHAQVASSSSGNSQNIAIQKNRFDVSDVSGFTYPIENAKDGCKMSVNDNDFVITANVLTAINCASDGVVEVFKNRFSGTGNTVGVFVQEGIARILENDFGVGNASAQGVVVSSANVVEAEISRNNFLSGLYGIHTVNANNGVVHGKGNIFTTTNAFFVESAGVWQLLELPERMHTTTVASATNVVLSPNYNKRHVTGTATIENLYLVSASGDSHKQFSATVGLIADGALTTANTGNIRPKSTSARTVGELMWFTYDPSTALWYEG